VGAAETLMAMVNEKDPFAPSRDDLWGLQLQAANERLAERRQQIPILDQLASGRDIDEIKGLEDVVALLFSDTVYKSYSEAFVDGGRWDPLTRWFATLSTPDFSNLERDGIAGIDAAGMPHDGFYPIHRFARWVYSTV
jgi:hypothetical protein